MDFTPDYSDKDEHIEYKLPDTTPHHRYRSRIGIDYGRRRSKQGKNNAGKHDNRTFKTYGGIALILLVGAFMTLKISSSTQSVYLPCCMS